MTRDATAWPLVVLFGLGLVVWAMAVIGALTVWGYGCREAEPMPDCVCSCDGDTAELRLAGELIRGADGGAAE